MISAIKLGDRLHHAYLLEGDRESILLSVKQYLKDMLKITFQGNPDYHEILQDTFGIEDSRIIANLASRKSFLGGKKVFLLAAGSMTHEAQNALLKLFEDPYPENLFFLIVPSVEILLPTLRSRLFSVSTDLPAGVNKQEKEIPNPQDFFGVPVPKRLLMVKDFITAIEKEKISRGTVVTFLNNLEVNLQKMGSESVTSKERATAFIDIMSCRSYTRDRSSSLKLILEHLALALPKL